MTTSTRHDEVSIHTEDPGILSVMKILSMTVEELCLKLQARNLVPAATAKRDLQHALLRAIAFVPPVEPAQAAASLDDASMGARFRTSSGYSNSSVELQLQLHRLELSSRRSSSSENTN